MRRLERAHSRARVAAGVAHPSGPGATGAMTKERFEYSQTIDGTFRGALGAERDQALLSTLLHAGLDLSRLAPAYPAANFYGWMRLAARHRWPDLPEEEGCRRIGRLCVERGLASTTLGRGVLQFIRILGPRPALLRLGSFFRIGKQLPRDAREGARPDGAGGHPRLGRRATGLLPRAPRGGAGAARSPRGARSRDRPPAASPSPSGWSGATRRSLPPPGGGASSVFQ